MGTRLMVTRRNRRRAASAPRIRLPAINWLRIAGASGALLVLAGVYLVTGWLLDRPIDAVVIKGVFQRVSAAQIEQALAPYVDTGFLSVDISAVRQELTRIPWVATADVRRRWPDSIEVFVTEQTAVATWGKSGLLNFNGELFVQDAAHLPAELPRLQGPQGTEAVVARRCFRVQELLEQRGLSLRSMSMDKRGAWKFELSNGVRVRIGAHDVDQRIARFFLALDQGIGAGRGEVAYIDMRYTNGFAVGWKNEKVGPHA